MLITDVWNNSEVEDTRHYPDNSSIVNLRMLRVNNKHIEIGFEEEYGERRLSNYILYDTHEKTSLIIVWFYSRLVN